MSVGIFSALLGGVVPVGGAVTIAATMVPRRVKLDVPSPGGVWQGTSAPLIAKFTDVVFFVRNLIVMRVKCAANMVCVRDYAPGMAGVTESQCFIMELLVVVPGPVRERPD